MEGGQDAAVAAAGGDQPPWGHLSVANLVARALGGIAVAVGLPALAAGCQLPHLGAVAYTIVLPAGLDPEVAAQRGAELLREADLLQTVAATAHGSTISLTTPPCGPSEVALAHAAAPHRARHGWSATGMGSLIALAQLSHLAQPISLVMLAPGQALQALQLPPGSPAAAVQQTAQRWDGIGSRALQAGLSQARMQGLLRVADTAAAVGADAALLPLANTGGELFGVPSLGLAFAEVALSAAATVVGAADELASIRHPAAAWSWLQRFAPGHSHAVADQLAADGWLASEQQLAASLVRCSGQVTLSEAHAVPRVQAGWLRISWLQLRFKPGVQLLLAVPRAKRRTLPPLGAAALQNAAEQHGVRLVCGPLEARQMLASRSGCQFLAVEGLAACGGGNSSSVLEALAAVGDASCVMVPLGDWPRQAANLASPHGLPAGCWNQLAAVVGEWLGSRPWLAGGGDADPGEEVDEMSLEQLCELLKNSAKQQPSRYFDAVASQLCRGSHAEGNDTMLAELERCFGAFGAGGSAADNASTHGSGSSTSTDSRDGGGSGSSGSSSAGNCGGSSSACRSLDLEVAATKLLLSGQVQAERLELLAGAPGGGPPGGGGSAVLHIFDRASSTDGPGDLGTSLGKQAACSGAVLGSIVPPGAPFPELRLYSEGCSVYAHQPADRVVLVRMLASVEAGHAVLVACLSRLARRLSDQLAILAFLAEQDVHVFTAAIGSFAAAPIAVAAAPASAAAGVRQAAAQLQDRLPAVAEACWRLSTEHAVYPAEHSLMQRVLACGSLPAADPRCQVLVQLGANRCFQTLARASEAVEHGGAQAGAGASAFGNVQQGTLSRQQAFLASLLRGLDCQLLQYNGASVSGTSGATFAAGLVGRLPENCVLVATAVHRLSRERSSFLGLLEAAAAKRVDVVVVLADRGILQAVLHEPCGAACAALGSELCGQLGSAAVGQQALQGFASSAQRSWQVMQHSANNTPALLPIVLTRCAPAVLEAAVAAVQRSAAFAYGRKASFSCSLHPAAAGAAAAGFAAFQAALQPNLGRGIDRKKVAAQCTAVIQAASAACGSEPSSHISTFDRASAASWRCVTCSCSPGQPYLQCLCTCQKCRRAAEALCACPASCDKLGQCSCPPDHPCRCNGCHKGGSMHGGQLGSTELAQLQAGGGSGEAGVGDSVGAAAAAAAVPRSAERPCQGPGCNQPACRSAAEFCAEACYLKWCIAGGVEPTRCPNADCLAVSVSNDKQPGLMPPGFVFGQRCCRECFNAQKRTNQNAKRAAARQDTGAGTGAAVAEMAAAGQHGAAAAAGAEDAAGSTAAAVFEAVGAALAGMASVPGCAGGSGSGSAGGPPPKKQRMAPAVPVVKEEWTHEEKQALVACAWQVAQQAAADNKKLWRLDWAAAKQHPKLQHRAADGKPQKLSGEWGRLVAAAKADTLLPEFKDDVMFVMQQMAGQEQDGSSSNQAGRGRGRSGRGGGRGRGRGQVQG